MLAHGKAAVVQSAYINDCYAHILYLSCSVVVACTISFQCFASNNNQQPKASNNNLDQQTTTTTPEHK